VCGKYGSTVLKYHVLGEVLYAQDIALGSQQANTLADQSVTITKVRPPSLPPSLSFACVVSPPNPNHIYIYIYI
jgi:hypothetical protein